MTIERIATIIGIPGALIALALYGRDAYEFFFPDDEEVLSIIFPSNPVFNDCKLNASFEVENPADTKTRVKYVSAKVFRTDNHGNRIMIGKETKRPVADISPDQKTTIGVAIDIRDRSSNEDKHASAAEIDYLLVIQVATDKTKDGLTPTGTYQLTGIEAC